MHLTHSVITLTLKNRNSVRFRTEHNQQETSTRWYPLVHVVYVIMKARDGCSEGSSNQQAPDGFSSKERD